MACIVVSSQKGCGGPGRSLGPLVKSRAKGGGAGEDKGAARARGLRRTNRQSGRGQPRVRSPIPRASRRAPKYWEQKREKRSESRREGGSKGASEEAEIRGVSDEKKKRKKVALGGMCRGV